MKKMSLLILLVIISCQKEQNITAQHTNRDSTGNQNRSQKESGAIKVIENKPVMNKDEIIRTVDASEIPFILNENFTKNGQWLTLKITNYNKPYLKANIITKEKDLNIRIGGIRLPDGNEDGPFSDKVSYEIKSKGEVWLSVGRNNMAEGKSTGSFSIKVE